MIPLQLKGKDMMNKLALVEEDMKGATVDERS